MRGRRSEGADWQANRHQRRHSEPTNRIILNVDDDDDDNDDDGDDDDDDGESCWNDTKRFVVQSRMHDLEISMDRERENMHLYLSEMVTAALEEMHWHMYTQQNSIPQTQTIRKAHTCPTLHSTSPCEQLADEYGNGLCNASCGNHEDEGISNENNCAEAEAVASSLLRHFASADYKPRTATDIQWLVSYAQAPQTLLPMPTDIGVFFDELGHNGRPIFFRGSENWAPPRKQWIFRLHPPFKSVQKLLEQQQYRCGGCGIKVAKVYNRRMRYCDYFGKLFCQRCHQGAKSRIPARIIYQWNFKEYPVSDIAYRFLSDNHRQPVINASAVDSNFYHKIRRLKKIRQLRIKLVHVWSYVRLCNVAEETVTKHGNLYAIFSTVPNYMLSDADVYSMEDLENVQKGELFQNIAPLVQYGQYHVEGCEHCRAQAFVCELCDQKDDLLFPFQIENVDRCEECGSLSHQKCAAKRRKNKRPCPKCVRIQQNFERHRCYSESSLASFELQDSATSSLAD